ncbi:MAG: flavin reductase family protein [Leptospiraceae bacterium]|nr:flavin reductase family protein [Leptospiraceae bacterium]
MAITKDDFKKAMGHWASGVTIVTYSENGIYSGLTASSFTSLSVDPFLVLFSVLKTSTSHDKILKIKEFAINILSTEQENLSNQFAKPDSDRDTLVHETGFTTEFTKSPLLKNSLCNLDCTLENVYEGGDHSIIVGKVHYAHTDETKRPLLYFYRKYYSI